jgi:hypothetical protein
MSFYMWPLTCCKPWPEPKAWAFRGLGLGLEISQACCRPWRAEPGLHNTNDVSELEGLEEQTP